MAEPRANPFFGNLSAWIRHPHRVPFRRALVQVHLWLALIIGVYVVVISLSGSAVVLRPEVNRAAVPRFVPEVIGEPATGDALAEAVARVYPNAEIERISGQRFPRDLVYVSLSRDGEEEGRLFDPYALKDMGSSYPPAVAFIEWLVTLHDDLLAGDTGRAINGVGGALMLVLAISGLILWWPGKRAWHRGLYIPIHSARKLWHLHSAAGFWLWLLLLNWSLTSLYLSFPTPFEAVRDWLDPDIMDFERPGDTLIPFLLDMHFGRFGGWWGRITWIVLGLTPALLFVTGFIVWWRGRGRGAEQA